MNNEDLIRNLKIGTLLANGNFAMFYGGLHVTMNDANIVTIHASDTKDIVANKNLVLLIEDLQSKIKKLEINHKGKSMLQRAKAVYQN